MYTIELTEKEKRDLQRALEMVTEDFEENDRGSGDWEPEDEDYYTQLKIILYKVQMSH